MWATLLVGLQSLHFQTFSGRPGKGLGKTSYLEMWAGSGCSEGGVVGRGDERMEERRWPDWGGKTQRADGEVVLDVVSLGGSDGTPRGDIAELGE